jgi:very-short-patch-repair endonuclease
MIEFESLKDLHLFLNVKNNPRKHWMNSSGWEMVECMHKFVLQNTKTIVWDFAFFALNANEVTTINN